MNSGANQARALALQYLRVAPGAPWRWEEDGRVLVWSEGTTFAFREEVNAVIDRLAPRGLPPFAAVAVLLAACRGKFPPPPGEGWSPMARWTFCARWRCAVTSRRSRNWRNCRPWRRN
ncbi:MAG: hypothetical protein WDM96_00990 [Lacunisphaera sp.]